MVAELARRGVRIGRGDLAFLLGSDPSTAGRLLNGSEWRQVDGFLRLCECLPGPVINAAINAALADAKSSRKDTQENKDRQGWINAALKHWRSLRPRAQIQWWKAFQEAAMGHFGGQPSQPKEFPDALWAVLEMVGGPTIALYEATRLAALRESLKGQP
jgi:hypothetical protein